jgi:STAM-binding protein
MFAIHVFYRNGSPSVDRSTKPDHFTSTGFAGLREVVIPSDLMRKFLVIAEHNTLRNIETCGILAGKLVGRMRAYKLEIGKVWFA